MINIEGADFKKKMKKVRFEEDKCKITRETLLHKIIPARRDSSMHSETPKEVSKTRPFIRKILPDEIDSNMATGNRKIFSRNRNNNTANMFGKIPPSLRKTFDERGKKRKEKIEDYMDRSKEFGRKTCNLIKSLVAMKRKIKKLNKVQTVVESPTVKQSVSNGSRFSAKWVGPRLKDLTPKRKHRRVPQRQPSVPPVDEKNEENKKTERTRRKIRRTRIAPLPEIKVDEKLVPANINDYDWDPQPFSGKLARKESSFQKIIRKNAEILVNRIRRRLSIPVTDRVDTAVSEPTIDVEEENPISQWLSSQMGADAIQPQFLCDVQGMEPSISCPFKSDEVATAAQNFKEIPAPSANNKAEPSSKQWKGTALDDKRRTKRKTKAPRRIFGRSNSASLPVKEEDETAEY